LYRYNLNRRIHDIKTYPALSPQGSSIVLYGHENGVTVVWRGGRRLKPAKTQPPKTTPGSKPNGSTVGADDAVMILDSDDEEPAPAAPATFVDRPEFEKEAVEDVLGYSEIIQTLDLALGTDVLHIAVLSLTPRPGGESSGDTAILSDRMVFAITCAAGPAYVITLPLTPPSHDSKAREELRTDLLAGAAGKGKWGETLTQLTGQFRHPDGIAITLARDRPNSSASSGRSSTHLIIAIQSKDASGALRLWDVPLEQQQTDNTPLEPFQTEFLPSPLTGIAFNPSPSHPTQLLAVASPHAVRIYDYSTSPTPQDDLSEGPWPAHGSWLISLYAPFIRGSVSCARKPIVGANWISHGRAIMALMADGQWGIWDVEGAGPLGNANSDSTSLFGKQSTALRGAALTAFNASGQLEGSSPLRTAGSHGDSFESNNDFSASGRRSSLLSVFATGPERLASVKGGVEVARLPSSRDLVSGEESVVLWISGSDALVCVVPVVAKFWDTQIRRSAGGGVNLFSGAQPSRMVRLTELNAGLLGERLCGVDAVPKSQRRQPAASDGLYEAPANGSTGLPVEVLVRGESRLVVVQDYQDIDTAPLRHPTQKKRLVLANKPVDPVNAIIVHQRPDAPKLPHTFENLSIRPSTRGSVQAQSTRLFSESFSQPHDNMDDEAMDHQPAPMSLPSRPRNMGLEFMDDLDAAADAGYELDAEDRDVENEIMDLMELDSHLEQMEEERMRGTKRVFFEES
ncbi:hypothetical protein M406DRAFT_48515, partial [Cryphonectria parasitica EP155]